VIVFPELADSTTRYASFEAGADLQVPLGFSVRGGQARGGVSVIGRAFNGLELERDGQPPVVLRGQFEAGLSFSTAPELRIWKFPLRWPRHRLPVRPPLGRPDVPDVPFLTPPRRA
jgi:hypothetical protein